MDIEQEFIELKSLSENFQKITPELLMSNPLFIRVLRLSTNMSHIELGKIYMEKFGKILRTNSYEYGHQKVGKKMAERLAKIFTELIKENPPSIENLRAYSQRINKAMESFKKGHNFEKEIESLLTERKIQFERDVRIKGKSGALHRVDFVIPTRGSPKYVIEAKETRGLSGHDSINKARVLVSLAIDMPENIKFIGAINGRWSPGALKMLDYYCGALLSFANKDEVLEEMHEALL